MSSLPALFLIAGLLLRPFWTSAPFAQVSPQAAAGVAGLHGWAPAPLGLAIAPDGHEAYVPFALDDALLVVNLDTMTTVASVDMSPAGSMLASGATALTPDGRKLYVANEATENVAVVDTLARRVTAVLPLKPLHAVAISLSGDGGTLFVPGWDGALYVVDAADDTYERIFVPGVIFGPVAPVPGDPDVVYSVGRLAREGNPPQPAFFAFRLSSRAVLQSLDLDPAELPPDMWARRLVVNAAGTRAWFGYQTSLQDRRSGNITSVSLGAGGLAVSSSTPVPNGVSDLAVDAGAGLAYVLGFWSGGGAPGALPVHVWDLDSNTLVREVVVSPSADQRAVQVDPRDPRCIYMTEGDHNLLRKVNVQTGEEVGRVLFHSESLKPYALLADGPRAYVVCQASRRVFMLDRVAGRVVSSARLPFESSAWGVHQGVLYVGGGDSLVAVNPADGTVIKHYRLEEPVNCLRLAFYGDSMAAIDYTGGMTGKRLLLFDAPTMTLRAQVPLPAEPHPDKLIVSPDGRKLYVERGVMMGGPTTITIYDAATLAVLNTIVVPAQPQRNGASSFAQGVFDEQARVLYLAGFTAIYRIDMDTDALVGPPLNLIDLYESEGISGWSPTGLSGLALSPGGERLYVVSGDAHTMYTYDLEGSAWLPDMTNVGGYFVTDALPSVDGSRLYTVNSRMDSISVIDLATGELERVLDLGAMWSRCLVPLVRRG